MCDPEPEHRGQSTNRRFAASLTSDTVKTTSTSKTATITPTDDSDDHYHVANDTTRSAILIRVNETRSSLHELPLNATELNTGTGINSLVSCCGGPNDPVIPQ